MQIQIQTIPFAVDSAIIETITQKLEKLMHFNQRIEKCNVILKEEKNDSRKDFFAEVHLIIPKEDLFASERAESFLHAVDMVMEDLKKQIIKGKEKSAKSSGKPEAFVAE
jgi:ribosomal subunit interface protein